MVDLPVADPLSCGGRWAVAAAILLGQPEVVCARTWYSYEAHRGSYEVVNDLVLPELSRRLGTLGFEGALAAQVLTALVQHSWIVLDDHRFHFPAESCTFLENGLCRSRTVPEHIALLLAHCLVCTNSCYGWCADLPDLVPDGEPAREPVLSLSAAQPVPLLV